MTSFFVSLVNILIAIVILAVLFIIGLILLIRGFLKKQLAEYKGKNTPRVFMIIGTVLISLPFLTIIGLALWSISSSTSILYTRSQYQCIPDVWRKESVSQVQAENDIVKALLTTADKGNRETFSLNFTPELQGKKGFDTEVDHFLAAYPVGLAQSELLDKTQEIPVENNDGDNVKRDRLSFRCQRGEEWYFVIIEYCYSNPDAPDKVGVTEFRVMNLEAAAVYGEIRPEGSNDPYLVCDIKSSDEINARLIAGRAYLWNASDKTPISSDQLRRILQKTQRLDDPLLKFSLGEPGLGIKHDDSTEYGYFFPLADEDGEPRYAYFQTDSESGNILWAYICTPYKIDYNHPLVEYVESKYRPCSLPESDPSGRLFCNIWRISGNTTSGRK